MLQFVLDQKEVFKFFSLMVFLVFSFVFQSQFLFIASVFYLLVYLIYDLKFSLNGFYLLFYFFVLFFPAFLSLNNLLSTTFYYILFSVSVLAAYKASRSSFLVLEKSVFFLFYTYVFFCLTLVFYYSESLEPFSEFVPGSSTNGIPSYLIVIQVLYSFLFYIKTGYMPIISTFFTLFISLVGVGRGSIIASLMILIFSFCFNLLFHKSRLHRFFVFLYFVVFLIVFYLFFFDSFFYFIENKTKLLQGFVDVYRLEIIHQYLEKIDFFSFFSGASFSGTVIESLYLGNPHISFIRTHAYFGIGGLVIISTIPFLFLFALKNLKTSFVFLFFVFVLYFRAFSEPILFPTLLDFLFFLFLFVYLRVVSILK